MASQPCAAKAEAASIGLGRTGLRGTWATDLPFEDDIEANALVLRQGQGPPVAVMNCDMLSMLPATCLRISDRVARTIGATPEQVGGGDLLQSARGDGKVPPRRRNSMSEVRYSRSVPIRHEVDVFVAGGGPTGVAAAVSAARSGLKVFLAESQGAFGGIGTLGCIPMFLGSSDGVRTVSRGIFTEVVGRLVAADATAQKDLNLDNFNQVWFAPETLKRVLDDMVQEAGVVFSFFTTLLDVKKRGRTVRTAILSAKSGLFGVNARVMVDATGDGDLCVRAGAPFEKGNAHGALIPGTLASLWAGIDWDTVFRAEKFQNKDVQLRKAIADGVFTQHDLHHVGIFRTAARLGAGNIGHLYGIDGTDERNVTKHMVHGRKMALEYQRFYREYMQGYENLELTHTATIPGIRETRRIMGDYVLQVADYQNRASFPDEIGRFHYPVDIHPHTTDAKAYEEHLEQYNKTFRFKPGESYGIPYRCLLPKNLDNVYVAGRCVSTDQCVQSSLRTMPGCFMTGMAAGVAAGLAVKSARGKTRSVKPEELRAELRNRGQYLP